MSTAAKDTLAALGLRRRGQSGLWIDDHGWWLVVVRFEPWGDSGYNCDAGVMHLWLRANHFATRAYGTAALVAGSGTFRGADGNAHNAATEAAQTARQRVIELRRFHLDDRSALKRLAATAPNTPLGLVSSGIAAVLLDDDAVAEERWQAALLHEWTRPGGILPDMASEIHQLKATAPDRVAFRSLVEAWIAESRSNLRLQTLNHAVLPIPDAGGPQP